MKNIRYPIRIILSIFITFLVITCATTSTVNFASLGKATDKVPLSKDALSGVLPNGLRYYILENSLPENRAYMALAVNAGSVLERDDQRGFAHFVEHMAFQGTERFPKTEITDYLRSLGSRFGANLNAYTSYNETVYHFDIPVETIDGVKRIPQRTLAILDDWTFAVSFIHEDVENEKRVVLEEIRTRLGAMERVRKITLPLLFKGSAYEDRDVIGLAEVIENATAQQLKDFYNRWYTSDNMALVFVGDFDGRALEAELKNNFNMPTANVPVNRVRYELPPPKKGNFHIEIITDPELTSAGFNIYYKQKPLAKRGTLDYYRESIIDYLISTMLSIRFEEITSDPDSASTEIWGGIWRWGVNSRFYSMGTSPKTGNAEQALIELLMEKESMRRFGFTQSELDRAKLSLNSYMERQLSEKNRRESRSFIRDFTNHFLYDEDMAGIEWEVNAVNLLLPGIGLKEIANASGKYFSYNDINVFLIAPQSEEGNLPSKERIRAIFNETQRMPIIQRKDETLSSDLLDKIPSAGTILSQTVDADTGSVILTLSNGARVILKETANRNNEIILYSMAKGGTINATQETIVSVSLLAEMVNVSGLGPYSRTDLINKLTGKQVSMSFWNTSYYRGFQGSSTTADLNALFEMIHIFFTNPRLDERAIAAMVDQYRTNLANQNENPQRIFSNELNRIISNNHPLFKPLEAEDMDKVSLSHAQDFLNKCINPSDYTFIFTGNIDLEKMKELSSLYIASIPADTPSLNMFIDPNIVRLTGSKNTIYKGVDQRSIIYLGWISRGNPAFNEKQNQVASVLSEYMDIVITDEIREKLGGVYSISSSASVSTIPRGENRIGVYFVCNPQRAEELIKAVEESLNTIINSPLNIDTFNKSKEALLMEHERSIQRNLHIAQSYANSYVLYNTPLNRLNLRPDVVRSVTPAEVQALCRQMLSVAPLQVVLFPDGW